MHENIFKAIPTTLLQIVQDRYINKPPGYNIYVRQRPIKGEIRQAIKPEDRAGSDKPNSSQSNTQGNGMQSEPEVGG
jgi:hypothetical protein